MELFRVLTVMNVDLVDVSSDLSVLLTGFLGVVWFAVGMIGVLACQHFFTRTPMVLQHTLPAACNEPAAVSCDHRGTGRGVRRDAEPKRGMTGGRQ